MNRPDVLLDVDPLMSFENRIPAHAWDRSRGDGRFIMKRGKTNTSRKRISRTPHNLRIIYSQGRVLLMSKSALENTMKIRKAEAHEKTQYAQRQPKPLYTLFGFVKVPGTLNGVKTSWQVAVEYLGEGKDEPNYEAIAPKGLHFAGEGTHTLLGTTQRDLLDRISGLEQCDESCE